MFEMGKQSKSSISDKCGHSHDEIVAQIQSASENTRWISEHMADLRTKYLHKFVAVHRGRIVAHSDDQAALFKTLREKESKNLSVISVEFITGEDESWIL